MMRVLSTRWSVLGCVVVALAAAGCDSSGVEDAVPVSTGPGDPSLKPIGRDGEGGGEAPVRKPESTPLGVD